MSATLIPKRGRLPGSMVNIEIWLAEIA